MKSESESLDFEAEAESGVIRLDWIGLDGQTDGR